MCVHIYMFECLYISCVYSGTCAHLYICVYGPVTDIGCLPQLLSILHFETCSFLECKANVFDQQIPGILLSLLPWRWDYRHALPYSGFLHEFWGIIHRFPCFHSKHFTNICLSSLQSYFLSVFPPLLCQMFTLSTSACITLP